MSKIHNSLIYLWMGGLLAACSNDATLPGDWQDGGVPVELTTAMADYPNSRATIDNTWDGGEEVGVELDGVYHKFIVNAQGRLTAAPEEGQVRWNSPDEVKNVSAWYPYSSALPQTFVIQKNQREAENYAKSDFLLASQTRIPFSGDKKIVFRHLPAKVVVNLKVGDGLTEQYLSNARVSFHNQSFTSGEIDVINGTVQQLPAGLRKDSVFSYVEEQPEKGFLKTTRTLLVPQLLMRGKPFLKVYTVQNGWFYYTPQNNDELSLQAGKKYVYNITVEKEGLSVHFQGETSWDNSDGNEEQLGKIPIEGFGAGDLKIFDYYYSDGTWSDGGYRRYADGTKAVLDIMPEEGKQVIGIVFQTLPERISKKEEEQGWKHGYVMAITSCIENPWTGTDWGWGLWGNNEIPDMKADVFTTFIACKEHIDGYEANRKVIDYIGKGSVEALKGTKYEAFYQACQYGKTDNTKQYAAPAKTSGWYLPSIGQWWDILENLFGCQFEAPAGAEPGSAGNGQTQPYSREYITIQLRRIPDATGYGSYDYWTSSMYDEYYSWYIGFDERVDEVELSRGRKDASRRVRSVLGF